MRHTSKYCARLSGALIFVALLVQTLFPLRSRACTNLIVGKKASVNGSVICSYNADDYGMFLGLVHYPAGTHAKGEMRQVYGWDNHVYHGQIPEAPVTYNVIGNINEYQLTIGETTYGGREEMINSTGILDYGSLIYITLQRSRTAREAIKVMTTLANTYGFNSSGETFTLCDPNEAWIMEMMGCGPGSKKVVWVAMRIPDNAICGHANQSRIGKFNQHDKQNVLFSPNAITFARSKGWFTGKDADFSWKQVYAAPDFSGRRFCDARVWSFFNRFSDDFSRYLPWALGKDAEAEEMPLWIVPNRKLSVQDVQAAMRDHYEGTPLAIDSTDVGSGIWQMPYRPTPLFYEVDGKRYFNERPISTQQAAFAFVSEMRAWLPREIGGVLWFGNDDGNMVAYTPVYCGNTVQPECYNTPGADAVTFSNRNAFWVCNWVSNMVYPRYAQLFPTLRAVRDSLEQSYFAQQPEVERRAQALYATNKAAALQQLNGYSKEQAQRMLERWNQLAVYLIVKYNDMVEKPTKDGQFLRTKAGVGARTKRMGFPAPFAKKLVDEAGDRYRMPQQ